MPSTILYVATKSKNQFSLTKHYYDIKSFTAVWQSACVVEWAMKVIEFWPDRKWLKPFSILLAHLYQACSLWKSHSNTLTFSKTTSNVVISHSSKSTKAYLGEIIGFHSLIIFNAFVTISVDSSCRTVLQHTWKFTFFCTTTKNDDNAYFVQPWEKAAAFGNAVVNAVLCWFSDCKNMPS